MESAYFLYNNYPYILAAYGYYKVVNTSYKNVQKGIKMYDIISGTYIYIFPPKIPNNWVSIDKSTTKDIKLIEPEKDIILIKRTYNDWEIIDEWKIENQKESF
jgi:hypothetical protein